MIGVFGAGGFIGRHIVQRLAGEKRDVRAVMRRMSPEIRELGSRHVDIVEADFEDTLAMASTLIGLDTVIQLVSTSSPGLGNRHAVLDVEHNVIPHIKFMNTCAEAGIKRYIFVSSGGTVYGSIRTCPIAEDHPTNPISSHGLTKLMTEKYLKMQSHVSGMEHVILRLANAFGPGQLFRKGQGLIPAVLDRFGRGEPIQIIGTGEARRDYIYIDDIVDACLAAADAPGPLHEIINIGSGKAYSVLEVLDTMEDILQARFDRVFIEARRTDVNVNQLDIRRASAALGWKPRTTFRLGLERMLSDVTVNKLAMLTP